MKPPGMHEHGSEERRKITGGIRKEAARNESPPPNKRVAATLLDKEKQDVQRNQGIRNQRNSSARGIVIADWEHRIDLLSSACKVGGPLPFRRVLRAPQHNARQPHVHFRTSPCIDGGVGQKPAFRLQMWPTS